jgi:hypothetical protein
MGIEPTPDMDYSLMLPPQAVPAATITSGDIMSGDIMSGETNTGVSQTGTIINAEWNVQSDTGATDTGASVRDEIDTNTTDNSPTPLSSGEIQDPIVTPPSSSENLSITIG